jgi:two-component system sensor histidine kinase PilS (NtrC family)
MLGAYFLDSRWAMAFAGAASILTGGGHFGLALGWLLTGQESGLDYLQGWPVVVTAVHVSVFLVTGMISGGLARRLERRRLDNARSRIQVQKARWEVRNILDNIRSGLLTVDRQGTITRVNPACCATLQLASRDLLGADIRKVLEGGMEDLAAIIMPVANGGAAVSRGEVRVTRNGHEMPLGLNVNPVAAPDGRCIGAIAIFTDLTREKEMNARIRESDRLAAIGELAASIAHEIRNPLASIRGSVEILAGELELEGVQRQLMDLVLKESARVNTIINDFLAYSRMPAAVKTLFAADEFLDRLVLQIEQDVAARGGRVRVRGEVKPIDLILAADQGQMTQLVLNLALNACQAMEYRGDLHVALSLVNDGESYELTVTDDGPGIDPEIRDQLFSPFKTTKEGGTGLGLSTAARIASSHGGTVRAEDAPGGGAIFRVRWPREPSAAQRQGPAAVDPAAEPIRIDA